MSVGKNKRILKNASFLYFRMIVVLGISLYTSRLILEGLGVNDFGIFTVVAGMVTMLSFLTGAMSTSTQRFLSYEAGSNRDKNSKNIFRMSINIYLIFVFFIVLVSETFGVWFLNNKLQIPVERLNAANWVFQAAIISFSFSILGAPFIASIVSSEKMRAFAYVGLVEAFLKLLAAFAITMDLGLGDKLIVYSILLAVASFIVWFSYYLICRNTIDYVNYGFYWNKDLFYKLAGFGGWSLIGNLALVAVNQGLNILLNLFFGPAINASRAISMQVNMAVRNFVINLQMSINPIITKSYASGDLVYMHSLVYRSSKYSCFLILFLSLPLLLKTELILNLWLGVVPEKAVIFCQLALIDSMIVSLSASLITSAQANGNIKKYQILVGGILMLNLPFSYLLFLFGAPAEVSLFVMITLSCSALFIRLALLRSMVSLSVLKFFRSVIFKVVLVVISSWLVMSLINKEISDSLVGFIILGAFTSLTVLASVVAFGLDNEERKYILSRMLQLLKKVR